MDRTESKRIELREYQKVGELGRLHGWQESIFADYLKLVPVSSLTDEYREILLDESGRYNVEFIVPVIAVALDAVRSGMTRDDFLYSCGTCGIPPKRMRDQLYHNGVTPLLKRRMATALPDSDYPTMRKQAMQDIKRATKMIYHAVRTSEEPVGAKAATA
jgi:hypothetical protein